jgi:hypothetical protein
MIVRTESRKVARSHWKIVAGSKGARMEENVIFSIAG